MYIYTTILTLCVYTVHIQYRTPVEYYLLLIVLWKGCIYFWYYGVFGSSIYWRNNGNSDYENFKWTNWLKWSQGILCGDWRSEKFRHEYGGLCLLQNPSNEKHNFVSFDFHSRRVHFVTKPIRHVFIHPPAIMCKIFSPELIKKKP